MFYVGRLTPDALSARPPARPPACATLIISAEGSFKDRRLAAVRAYHEWLPTRVGLSAPDGSGFYRSFQFGEGAAPVMFSGTWILIQVSSLSRTSQTVLT